MINTLVVAAFVAGILLGLAIAAVVFGVLAYFRAAIEYKVKIIEKQLGSAGPKPQGAIFEPEDEAEIARREIIERNRAQGKDTPLSELQ